MSGKSYEVRLRKFMKNPLLSRKQMAIEVVHPNMASVSRKNLRDSIATKLGIKTPGNVVVYGIKVAFGGGRSSGFALVYDNKDAMMVNEPKYRLVRNGMVEASSKNSRKSIKELKNRKKKVRGMKKAKIGVVKK